MENFTHYDTSWEEAQGVPYTPGEGVDRVGVSLVQDLYGLVDRGGGYGGGYGEGNMTLEILGLLLALAFIARVLIDMIWRASNGRSLPASPFQDLDTLTQRVLSAVSLVEAGRDILG